MVRKLISDLKVFREKSKKRNCPDKCRENNEFSYERYQRCCFSNIYPNDPMLKEKAMTIKKTFRVALMTSVYQMGC